MKKVLSVSFSIALLICMWIQLCASQCNYNFDEEADFVFVMDRSASIGRNNFYRMKDFIKSFIGKFLIMRREHHRIAVVTHGRDVTTAIDFVSENQVSDIAECELFLSNGVWETEVNYDPDNADSGQQETFPEAYEVASAILRHRDRQRKSMIWIMSDLEEKIDVPTQSDEPNSTVYGFGIGGNLYWENFMQIVTEPFNCNAMNMTRWHEAIEGGMAQKSTLDQRKAMLMNTSLCLTDCDNGCTCREFEQTSDNFLQCVTPLDGESEEQDGKSSAKGLEERELLWWVVIAGAGALILISLLIIVCACCIRQRRHRQRLAKYKQRSVQQPPVAGMPEPSTFTVSVPTTPPPANHPDLIPTYRGEGNNESDEDDYVNEGFEKDLRAHGIHTSHSDKEFTAGMNPKPKLHIYKQNNSNGSNPPSIPPRYDSSKKSDQSGHSRQMSNASVSSVPQYFAPIPSPPQSQQGEPPRFSDVIKTDEEQPRVSAISSPYSYPYLDLEIPDPESIRRHMQSQQNCSTLPPENHYAGRLPEASPISGHNYELFTFPRAKHEATQDKPGTKNVDKKDSASCNLSEAKGKLRPISKVLSFKKKETKDVGESSASPSTSTTLVKPKITDVSRDYVNIEKPKSEYAEAKSINRKGDAHSSKKLGRSKFDEIKARLKKKKVPTATLR